MARINNNIKRNNDGSTIIYVTKDNDISYLKEVIIDTNILPIIHKVRVGTNGYVYTNKIPVAHVVLEHESNMLIVVDHINGNKLDNRKLNLRKSHRKRVLVILIKLNSIPELMVLLNVKTVIMNIIERQFLI